MTEKFTHDVFLSHSTGDKEVVRALADKLKSDGLRVWFDEWEIQPGEMIGKRIEEGLVASRVLVLCMSVHAFESEWSAMESGTFRFRDTTNKERRFIPLRLDDVDVKDSLRQYYYVDWRKRDEKQYARLLAACLSKERNCPSDNQKQASIKGKALSLGYVGYILGVALSDDGCLALSGAYGNTVRIWEVKTGRCLAVMEGHTGYILSVALSGDGCLALSGSEDKTMRVWDVETGRCLVTMKGHTSGVRGVALSGDGRLAFSGSEDKTGRVWDVETGRCPVTMEGHTGSVNCVALSGDGRLALSGSEDKTVRVWAVETGRCIMTMKGHTSSVRGVALSSDGRLALSGSEDTTLRVWAVETGRCLVTMEGHTGSVHCVALSSDGRLALSGSSDRKGRVWEVETGRCLATMEGHYDSISSVALSGDGHSAFSMQINGASRMWSLEEIYKPALASMHITASGGVVAGGSAVITLHSNATRYTNAKVLLIGDSGVGKTGLAYRLTENRFVPTASTDGVEMKRPDWATHLNLVHNDRNNDIEREIWIWDFAGQADYRLIHQLFMDETALAVLVFNPQSENPFEGLSQWDHDLRRASRRKLVKILVAGRCDRGGVIVSQEGIEHFRRTKGFAEYIATSALQGSGCDELRDAIIRHISWKEIPWIASPYIFRILKEEIIKLKDEGKVLLRVIELKQQLQMRLLMDFTMEELHAVVGLLAGPGIVWKLEFGDFVLLNPERVNSYAAAVIRSVRSHTEEIGCIAEEKVQAGDLDFQDMERLPMNEEQVVLRAMHQTFVDHGLCLREKTEQGNLLVFPSYFKRERPKMEDHPLVLVTYRFSGSLDEIYATLVVRLHYSMSFAYDKLWRFAADYRTPTGKRLGLKMTKKNEGTADLEVYFDPGIPADLQVTFIRYVHEHLEQKAHEMVRVRHYICSNCETPVEGSKAIDVRLEKGFKDIFCAVCGRSVLLWDLIEEKFSSEEYQRQVRELEEKSKVGIDNESLELILIGHSFAIAGEAGQIFRPTPNSDWGIDGEIEFKNHEGEASGKRIYLQLKSGDSYLYRRKSDGAEIFAIKKERHAEYWQQQAYPVMLVIRTLDGAIRWMDVSEYLKLESDYGEKAVKQVVFKGEPFTTINLRRMRDRVLAGV
jgi:small GTP-binding protein